MFGLKECMPAEGTEEDEEEVSLALKLSNKKNDDILLPDDGYHNHTHAHGHGNGVDDDSTYNMDDRSEDSSASDRGR